MYKGAGYIIRNRNHQARDRRIKVFNCKYFKIKIIKNKTTKLITALSSIINERAPPIFYSSKRLSFRPQSPKIFIFTAASNTNIAKSLP